MKVLRLMWLAVVALLALAACSSGSQPIRELLALSDDEPTFVYFFTEA